MVLTPTPEFHLTVGIPRSVAIEYPYGRPVGQINDKEGQTQVLRGALAMFDEAREPGEIRHLPFTWPEEPREADWHPPEPAPIIRLLKGEIKQARKEQAVKDKTAKK